MHPRQIFEKILPWRICKTYRHEREEDKRRKEDMEEDVRRTATLRFAFFSNPSNSLVTVKVLLRLARRRVER